jgi:hypothetical protein
MFNRLFNRTERDLTSMDNMDNMAGSIKSGRRVFYYVGAMYNGQPIVLGRFFSYEQADDNAKRKLGDIRYKIYPKTCDMRTATKEVKYDLMSPNNIDDVMARAKHVIEPEEG